MIEVPECNESISERWTPGERHMIAQQISATALAQRGRLKTDELIDAVSRLVALVSESSECLEKHRIEMIWGGWIDT